MEAKILLEDGTLMKGKAFGAAGMCSGELVFNTSMTGYQEMLTDPSYCGQVLTLTYPMIGSYGVNDLDFESKQIWAKGLLVANYIDDYSHYAANASLADFLKKFDVQGIDQIDTRLLTLKVRERGSMKCVLASGDYSEACMQECLNSAPDMAGANLAKEVCCDAPYTWNPNAAGKDCIAVLDCGVKYNILRSLDGLGYRVEVLPYKSSLADIEALSPKGILISNGPGDPAAVEHIQELLQQCFGKYPMLGICLGHQILALSLGAKTYKLPFGHHGANHPILNKIQNKIEITSQNHGFAVDTDSLLSVSGADLGEVRVTHTHLTDHTLAGFQVPKIAVQSIQYHPEASPGPRDASYIFESFDQCIKTFWKN